MEERHLVRERKRRREEKRRGATGCTEVGFPRPKPPSPGKPHLDPHLMRVEGVGGLVVVCQRVRAEHAAVVAAEVGKGQVVVAGDAVNGGVALEAVPGVPREGSEERGGGGDERVGGGWGDER
jgi:hypothetical protein